VLTEGYDVDRLWESFYALDDVLDLDIILVDIQAGVNEEIMNIISGTLDHLILLLTPTPGDLMGTAMLVDLAEKLEVLNLMVVVNKVGPKLNPEKLRSQLLAVCHKPITTLLPLAPELLYGNSRRPFCLQYAHHPLTQGLGHLLENIFPSP
jgi:septum site-determining protein MinD